MAIGGMLTVALGGFLYLSKDNAGGVITSVDSPVITISREGDAVRYRDLNGEYRVRHAHIVINGWGFLRGGGVVQDKDGPTEVSRYALRFDDNPFPMSDLQVATKNGTQLSGVIRVPVEMLTDTEIRKRRPIHVYDRIEGRFVKVIARNAVTVQFKIPPPATH